MNAKKERERAPLQNFGSDPNQLCHVSEDSHQMALFCACSLYQDSIPELRWYHAVPNGGSRGTDHRSAMMVGALLKSTGTKAGVSDTYLPVPRQGYHGLYIELKRPGGTETAHQKEFGAFVQAQGYLYYVADHWAKAFRALMWYLGFSHTQDWLLPDL